MDGFASALDCGSIPLAADDRAAVKLDEGWLMSRLRMALEIESRDGVTNLGEGVWRLGEARKSSSSWPGI